MRIGVVSLALLAVIGACNGSSSSRDAQIAKRSIGARPEPPWVTMLASLVRDSRAITPTGIQARGGRFGAATFFTYDAPGFGNVQMEMMKADNAAWDIATGDQWSSKLDPADIGELTPFDAKDGRFRVETGPFKGSIMAVEFRDDGRPHRIVLRSRALVCSVPYRGTDDAKNAKCE